MTTQFKGTPGPWFIRTDKRYDYAFSVEKEENGLRSIIALMNDQWICEEHGELLANARLIAAAPELLEALMHCIDELEVCSEVLYPTGPDNTCARARAAIAKALGNENGSSTLGAVGLVAALWAIVMLGAFVYYF